MLILGLLLIAAAVVVGWAIIADATEPQQLDVFGVQFDTTGAGVFIAGAATMLALVLGIALLQLAMARARKRRQKNKALKNEKKESVHRLEEEKAHLAAELDEERRRREEISRLAATSGSSSPSARSAGGERDDLQDSRQYGPPIPQGGASHGMHRGTVEPVEARVEPADSSRMHADGTPLAHDEHRDDRGHTDSNGGKLAGLRSRFDKNHDGHTDSADLRGRHERTVDVTDAEARERRL